MKIGNLPKLGEAYEMGKRYWCIEIGKRPPTMYRVFKPYIFIAFIKMVPNVDPINLDYQVYKPVGFKQWFIFPWGITIEISR